MPLLPYPTNGVKVLTVSSLPANAKNGTVVFNTADGNYYARINNQWYLCTPPAANKINILQGQPIGLMGITYAGPVN